MTSRCFMCRESLYDGQTLTQCGACPDRAVLCQVCLRSTFPLLCAAVQNWKSTHQCQRLKRGGGLEMVPA